MKKSQKEFWVSQPKGSSWQFFEAIIICGAHLKAGWQIQRSHLVGPHGNMSLWQSSFGPLFCLQLSHFIVLHQHRVVEHILSQLSLFVANFHYFFGLQQKLHNWAPLILDSPSLTYHTCYQNSTKYLFALQYDVEEKVTYQPQQEASSKYLNILMLRRHGFSSQN